MMGTKQQEQRQRIEAELRADAGRSDRYLAKIVGCSANTVTTVRREMERACQIGRFTFRGGGSPGHGIHTGTRCAPSPTSTTEHPLTSSIYVIGSPGVPLVKIGLAYNVALRLSALQNSCPVPLEILWQTEGGRRTEQKLHAAFAGQRRYGEWFDLGPDPVAAITAILAV